MSFSFVNLLSLHRFIKLCKHLNTGDLGDLAVLAYNLSPALRMPVADLLYKTTLGEACVLKSYDGINATFIPFSTFTMALCRCTSTCAMIPRWTIVPCGARVAQYSL